MKSEERHQLEQNELADWLARSTANLRTYLPLVAGIVVILLVFAFGYSYWNRAKQAELHDAWQDFLNASNSVRTYSPSQAGEDSPSMFEYGASQFEEVASGYPGTEIAARARLRAADYRFEFAKTFLLKDHGEAISKLNEVIDEYDRLARDRNAPADVQQQAYLGKALAQESKGALKDARDTWQQIVTLYEGTNPGLAVRAKQRIEKLQDERVQNFYAKLEEYKPATPSLDLPDPSGDDTNLPDFPNMNDPAAVPPPPSFEKQDVSASAKDEKAAKEEKGSEPKKEAAAPEAQEPEQKKDAPQPVETKAEPEKSEPKAQPKEEKKEAAAPEAKDKAEPAKEAKQSAESKPESKEDPAKKAN